MPPKRAAAAVSKATTNGATTVKAVTAASNHVTKKQTGLETKDVKASKKTTTASKTTKRKADEEPDEPKVNGVSKRQRKQSEDLPTTRPSTKAATHETSKPAKAPATKPAKAPAAKLEKALAVKKPKVTKPKVTKPKVTKPKAVKDKVIINRAPAHLLELYTFGGGEAGELGFAGAKGTKEIRRPRINPYLAADKAGVVQFSVGGMHTACLTHDNRILTWGVNDQGALGRDTTWDGGLTDMNDKSDDDSDDSDSEAGEINPHESTPREVDFSGLSDMPVITQVCATDSATFAVTDDGLVYGWGTFRSNEGIFGFSQDSHIQKRPVLVENLKNITSLAGGNNHVLALDNKGSVFAWGAGQQNQLGRRILERHQIKSLLPAKFGLPRNMVHVGAGAYHSFAVQENGNVYSWGLNSFGQTGAEVNTEEGSGGVHLAIKIPALSTAENGKVVHITGGSHHSIAVTDKGKALAWGRLDGFQVGIDIKTLPADHLIKDASDRPRILTIPTQIPGIDAVTAGAGSDHSIVISKDGKAYSFGFNEYGQAGVGTTDDVQVATLIDNTAVRDKKLVAAGCGGQFSVLGSVAHLANGINGHA